MMDAKGDAMSLTDARGVPTSTANRRSLDAFEAALRQLNTYRGNPVETLDAALADDPDFVLGHIARAEIHITMWEGSVLPEIQHSLARLDELSNRCNERERAHVAAIRDWAAGDWRGLQARLDAVLVDYPRDALALQVGHLSDFYHGDRDNLRGRVARALPAWSPNDVGYGFVLGMKAFGLEECADYGQAEETGRHAIALDPDDCWAHHAVAHVMEMQARQAEGITWMEGRSDHWAQDDNAFAFHNWWHASLYHLDLDRIDRVLAIYDERIRPAPSEVQLEMLDAVALLWRLHLRGIDVGDRWRELADAYERTSEDGFYVFNDMHAMMTYVATDRRDAAARVLAAAERVAQGGGTNARMTRAVGLPIVRAVEAFGQARYDEAVDLLMPVRYHAHAFGGSHAQRDIVHRTALESAHRAGRHALAHALAAERTALKPHCPFSWTLRERARQALAAAPRH